MKAVKIYLLAKEDSPKKTITIKDVGNISIANGALEVFGNRKDEKDYTRSVGVAGFASGTWQYFEEA